MIPRRSFIFWLVFLLGAPLYAQEKVRVGISNFSASYAPLFVAKKRGFYPEEGLAVEIILIPGLLGTQALIGGSVDFGSASNPNAAVKGAKLKIVYVFNDKPVMALIARPGIKAIDELRGKRLGVSTIGSLDHGWLKELLPKVGLNPERDVTFLGMGATGARFAAMKAGSIEATLAGTPANFLAQDAGFSTLARVGDHIEDIQATIVATDDKLAQQGERARRFIRATVKGQRSFLANRKEAIEIIQELTGLKDRDLAAKVYDHHLYSIARDGAIPERLQRIVIDRAKRMVGVSRDIPSEEIFDFSYLRRASVEVERSGWRP